jgi:TP901 family phage tail tape measure protein
MANKQLMANIRVQIGGVDVSIKHLAQIQDAANALRNDLSALSKQYQVAFEANDARSMGILKQQIDQKQKAIKTVTQLAKFEENQLMQFNNVLENMEGTTLNGLTRALRVLQTQMKETNKYNEPTRWKELEQAYRRILTVTEQLNGKMPNLAYVMKNLGDVSNQTLRDSEKYLKQLIETSDKGTKKLTEPQKAALEGYKKNLESVQRQMKKRTMENITPVLSADDTSSRSKSEMKDALKQADELIQKAKVGTKEYQTLSDLIKQGNEKLSKVTSSEMLDNYKRLSRISNESLADQRKYWEDMIKNTERGSTMLQTYETRLKHVKDEEERRSKQEAQKQIRTADKTMANLDTASNKNIKEAISIYEAMLNTTKRNTDEWQLLTWNIEKAKGKLEEYANDEKIVNQILSEMKADKVVLNSDQYSKTEIEQAIQSIEALRDKVAIGGEAWERYTKQIESAQNFLKSFDANKSFEKRATLSNDDLERQRKYWKNLSESENENNDRMKEYRANMLQIVELQNKRTREQAKMMVEYSNTTSLKEMEDMLKKLREMRDSASDLGKAVNLEGEIQQLEKVYNEKKNAFTELFFHGDIEKQSSERLEVMRKYYEDELQLAKSASKQEQEARKKDILYMEAELQKVQQEQATRSRRATEDKAEPFLNNASYSQGTGQKLDVSLSEAKEALAALNEYKDMLRSETDKSEIEAVNQAILQYTEVVDSAKAVVQQKLVDFQNVIANPENYTLDEVNEAIKQMEEQLSNTKGQDLQSDATQQLVKNIANLKQTAEDMKEAMTFDDSEDYFDDLTDRAMKGEASVKDLEDGIKILKQRLDELPPKVEEFGRSVENTEIEDTRREIDLLNSALFTAKQSTSDMNRVLGNLNHLGDENLTTLKGAAKAMEENLQKVATGSKAYAQLSEQLRTVKRHIKEVEKQSSSSATAFENALSRLKNWVLVYASFDAMKTKVQDAIRQNIQFSDAMSDVRKVTGLTADEVGRLSTKIQDMNTRISDSKLMEAATEGGRLGLKSAEDILAFTKASAITLTALDELDAKSIASVMKLNSLLGETKRLGVQDAILSTASAINELSIASAASQAPIIEFSRRFGGIASQAKISTSEVAAIGATLDALGQPVEMASTAMNKFTTALLANQAQIAQDTGISEEYMRKLTQQGKTIEVMIEVLSRLQGMNGIAEISKYMGDMGGDGARMTSVISALASNVGFLREQLVTSNQAFAEGASVINEYNLKNDNAAALVERMGNSIKAAFVNDTATKWITNFLRPIEWLVSTLTSTDLGATMFANGLKILLFLFVTGSTVTRTFTGELWKMSKSFKDLTGSIALAIKGTMSWGTALKLLFTSNPIGLIITLGSVVLSLVEALKSAKDETSGLGSAVERSNDRFDDENAKLERLEKNLNAAVSAKQGLAEVISNLNRNYSTYLGYLVDESARYQEVAAAINVVREALHAKALEEEQTSVVGKARDEFRDQRVETSKDMKEGLSAYLDSSYRGAGKHKISDDLKKQLYNSLIADFNSGLNEKGQVQKLSDQTMDLVGQMAKKINKNKAANNLSSVTPQEIEKQKQEIVKAIGSYSSAYRSVLMREAKRIKSDNEELDAELRGVRQKQSTAIDNSVKTIFDTRGLEGKDPKDFSEADETALRAVKANLDNEIKILDPQKDADKIKELNERVDKTKEQLRKVMLAYIDNPLKGYKFENEKGKWKKVTDEEGNLIYEAVGKFSDATLSTLVNAYRTADKRFEAFKKDNEGREDIEFFSQSKRLSNLKKSIKAYLKEQGIDINDKYVTSLDDSVSKKSGKGEGDDIRKSYQALLNNIREFYDQRADLIQQAYKRGELTDAQYRQQTEKNERGFYRERANMFNELLGNGDSFNEELIIKDQSNWKKVMEWVRSKKNHMEDTVAKDLAETNKRINESEIKELQDIEAILIERNPYRKISREYQQSMENLFISPDRSVFAMKTDDLGEWTTDEDKQEHYSFDANKAQARADAVMDMYIKAVEDSRYDKNKTFQQAVEGNEKAYELLRTVAGEGSQKVLDITEEQWEAIYQIAVKASEAIDEKRKQDLTKNTELLNSMYEHDKEMSDITKSEKDLSAQHEKYVNEAQYGAHTERDLYLENISYLKDTYDYEVELYKMRITLATDYFNRKYAAAKDEAEREEVLLQKQAYNRELNTEMDSKNIEYQQNMTNAYNAEMNRRLEKYRSSLEAMGELAGTMATAEMNSINDRMAAVNKLANALKDLLLQEIESELKRWAFKQTMASKEEDLEDNKTKSNIKGVEQRVQSEKSELLSMFKFNKKQNKKEVQQTESTQEKKTEAVQNSGLQIVESAQQTNDKQVQLSQDMNTAMNAVSEDAMATAQNIQDQAAASSVSTSMKETTANLAMDETSAIGKEVGSSGLIGFAKAAVITAAFAALSTTLNAVVSKLFPSATSSSGSSKKLATGMLTYATGRYVVDGNDGHTYEAQYEPTLQTGIYDGGNGKAHMALFSEVMPEMVISGPTTRNIQQNYPELMDAIMTVEKQGRMRKALPTYASGTVSSFAAPSVGTSEDEAAEQQAQFMASMARMSDASEALLERLAHPITAEINMYGKNGAKENFAKAEKFYKKNKL